MYFQKKKNMMDCMFYIYIYTLMYQIVTSRVLHDNVYDQNQKYFIKKNFFYSFVALKIIRRTTR